MSDRDELARGDAASIAQLLEPYCGEDLDRLEAERREAREWEERTEREEAGDG